MADLKLDLRATTPYDLDLTTADLQIVDGDDAIVQQLTIRFGFFLGEWDFDRTVGIPYYTDVLVKNPSLSNIRSLFRRAITTTPGVNELLELTLDLDAGSRTLLVEFSALKDDGEILDYSRPFVLSGGTAAPIEEPDA